MALDKETQKLDREILEFMDRQAGTDERAFGQRALKIFDYQFRRNMNYRNFCLSENKKPGRLNSWKDIPAMPTDAFKELVLATFPLKDAVKVFKPSGTPRGASATGMSADVPLRGAHFFDTLKLYETAILPPFREYLMPDEGDFFFCFLVNSPEESPDSSLSYMMGVVNRVFAKKRGKFYAKAGKISHRAFLSDLRKSKKKIFILATAFSLKSFLDFLGQKKVFLKLPKGSRLMETGGFKGRVNEVPKHKLYAECEKRLGIPKDHCVSEYGMTELSSQFYDTTLNDKIKNIRRKPFKAGPAWLRALVIDPRTGKEAAKGQPGLLRHFDLANRGSVLAIQTEDLGRQVGTGFEFLGRASGAELRGCSLHYE